MPTCLAADGNACVKCASMVTSPSDVINPLKDGFFPVHFNGYVQAKLAGCL